MLAVLQGKAALFGSKKAQRPRHLAFQDVEKSCGEELTWGQTVLSPRAIELLVALCILYASMKHQTPDQRHRVFIVCV